MRRRPVGSQQITGIVWVPEAQAIVQPEGLDGSYRFHAPVAKVPTFQGMVRIPIWPVVHRRLLRQAFLRRPIQLGVPLIHEGEQKLRLPIFGSVDGLQQSPIRLGIAELGSDLAVWLTPRNDTIQ